MDNANNKSFEVVNAATGHSFGVYEAATEDAAIAAMLADAGHDGPADEGIEATEV